MLSYWEKETLSQFDLVVVGAGIVGMSTAYHFKKSNPGKSVVIVERGLFPSGASTKNAGFVCFGSLGELLATEKEIGRDQMLGLVERRYQGGLQLRNLLGEAKIDYRPVGGYELCFDAYEQDQIHAMNEALRGQFSGPVFSSENERINDFGFHSTRVAALVKNDFEGTIDSGKMVRAFQELAAGEGVQFLMNSEVLELGEAGGSQVVEVRTGPGSLQLRAEQVALCTNAFSGKFAPDEDVVPGRGMVLVSKPVQGFGLDGSFHYHNGYHYFRSVGNRLLLGGGRQLDLEGETTLEEGLNEKIYGQLVRDMDELIAPGLGLEVDYAWSGTMAFGGNGRPVVKRLASGLAGAFRLGGMGVALGTQVGKELATILEG